MNIDNRKSISGKSNLSGKSSGFSLLQQAGVYTITNIINSAIPFLMLPILTRYLSPADFGIVAMFQVLLGIASAFTGLNVYGAVGRQYFERTTLNFPRYIGNCLFILFASSAVVGLVLWLGADFISRNTEFPADYLWAVLLVSMGQFLIMTALTLWQVRMKPKTYGVFQILLTITNVGLSLWLIIGLSMNWQGRVQAQVWSYLLFGLVALILLWRGGWIEGKWEGGYIRNSLVFGVPLIPHVLGSWAIAMTGRLFVTNMVGIADTGIYMVGAQVGMVIGLLQSSFNSAWVPWLFGELKKDDPAIKIKIVRITYLYNFLILLPCLLLIWIGPWFLSFFVGKDFSGASHIVGWIALGYAFDGMYKMVANYFFYIQKTYILAWITFFTAVVNIVSCYFLVRLHGTVGAAQGTMVAFLLSFLLTWIIAARMFSMPWLASLKIRRPQAAL
jgi:O-antigen/teichoic acid export membrane protein